MTRRAIAASGIFAMVAGITSCLDRVPQPETPTAVDVVTAPLPKPRCGRVTSLELHKLVELQQNNRALLIDVRPVFFHSLGHIPGSINWPKSAFDAQRATREAEVRAARKDGKVIVLYCTDAACPDALAVAERLVALGHDVSVLEGGWEAWKSAGLSM